MLPRIYELSDSLQNPGRSDNYFQGIGSLISGESIKLKVLKDIEAELQVLDDAAWSVLKNKVKPYLQKKIPQRGWQQIFDLLNEAKGYIYLVSLKCQSVEFIPESDQKTPDLKAKLGTKTVLCDVKTINPSEEEVDGRQKKIALKTPLSSLTPQFFNKIFDTVKAAKEQMEAYCFTENTMRIAYVILNFDDLLHDYAHSHYSLELEEFKSCNFFPGIEIIFDFKPPFYWAQHK